VSGNVEINLIQLNYLENTRVCVLLILTRSFFYKRDGSIIEEHYKNCQIIVSYVRRGLVDHYKDDVSSGQWLFRKSTSTKSKPVSAL
jgi:hypothetical protein